MGLFRLRSGIRTFAAEPRLFALIGSFYLPSSPRWQRDRLLAELGALQSNDEAANWAHRSLPSKNTLTVADAQLVEAGFQVKLAAFGESAAWGALGRRPKPG